MELQFKLQYQILRRSFDQVLYDVFIGEVRYIDYKTESFFDGTDYNVEGSMGLALLYINVPFTDTNMSIEPIARDQPGHELFGLMGHIIFL